MKVHRVSETAKEIGFNVEEYFNEYNETYARLIPAALKAVTDRWVARPSDSVRVGTETLIKEADYLIRTMLSKREDAIMDRAKNFGLKWEDNAPDL